VAHIQQAQKTRPRGRPPGTSHKARFDRSEELAAAALDLFAARNFASVTIKEIANAADVNTALIYYYFESKADLFRAAIEFVIDQAFKNFRQLQARHDSPADVINDWLDSHVQLYAPIHKFVKVSLDYSGSETSIPLIDRQIRQFYDEEKRILSGCIRQGIQSGLFAAVDPESLALFISTYLDGVMVRIVVHDDFDLNQAIGILRQHIWTQLGYDGQTDNSHSKIAANI
jgi:AcrR family transcriptional regulator